MLHVAVTFGFAWMLREYRPLGMPHQHVQERDPEVGRMVFAYGLFDEKDSCNDHLMLCVLSWCCLPIQWATTLTKDKVRLLGSFWVALTIAASSFHELNNLTVGFSHLLFVIIAVYYRQKLREKFGLESGSLETITQDCIVWCFCCYCAAAQEARQVDYVKTPTSSLVPFGGTLQLQRSAAPPDFAADAEEADPAPSAGLLQSNGSSGSDVQRNAGTVADDSGY